MTNEKYAIANWKMNLQSEAETKELAEKIIKGLKKINYQNKVNVILMPSYPWIKVIKDLQQKSPNLFAIGAQNMFWEKSGAYTGEISSLMLKNLGCQYVFIGHSERIIYLKETNEMLNKKLLLALKSEITPILILHPEEKNIENFKKDLIDILQGISQEQIEKIIFTYEPIEAISTQGGKIPSQTQLFKMNNLIRKIITDYYHIENPVQKIKLIYGGSVNSTNIRNLTIDVSMEGAIVGAKSLDAQEFVAIIKQLI